MENKKKIQLKEAIEVGGATLTEIEVRRSTIGDEEDAMQTAVQMKRAKNPLTVEMCLMARVTRLPYDKLRQMHGQDYAAIRAALNELNGVEAPEEDEENPMTPSAS